MTAKKQGNHVLVSLSIFLLVFFSPPMIKRDFVATRNQQKLSWLHHPSVSELFAEKLPQAWCSLPALWSDTDFSVQHKSCPSHVVQTDLSLWGCSYQPSIKDSTWIRGHDPVKRQIVKCWYLRGRMQSEHFIKKSLVWGMKHFRVESLKFYIASL